MLDYVCETMVEVHDPFTGENELHTVAEAHKMGWSGRFVDGWFIRHYNSYTGQTWAWYGPYKTEDDAALAYLNGEISFA